MSVSPLRQPIVAAAVVLLLIVAVYVVVNLRHQAQCRQQAALVSYRWGMPGRCEVLVPRLR